LRVADGTSIYEPSPFAGELTNATGAGFVVANYRLTAKQAGYPDGHNRIERWFPFAPSRAGSKEKARDRSRAFLVVAGDAGQ
jgi:hypothetical protein